MAKKRLVDVRARSKSNPNKFNQPSAASLRKLSRGSVVKLCVEWGFPIYNSSEVFSAVVIRRNGKNFIGKIDGYVWNWLETGLGIGCFVEFRSDNILEVSNTKIEEKVLQPWSCTKA